MLSRKKKTNFFNAVGSGGRRQGERKRNGKKEEGGEAHCENLLIIDLRNQLMIEIKPLWFRLLTNLCSNSHTLLTLRHWYHSIKQFLIHVFTCIYWFLAKSNTWKCI